MAAPQSSRSPDTEGAELTGFERLATLADAPLYALASKPLTDAQRKAVDAELARRLAMRTPPRIEPAPPTRPTFLLLQDTPLILEGHITSARRGELVSDFRIGYFQQRGAPMVEVTAQWRASNEMGQTQVHLELADGTAAIPSIGVGYALLMFAAGERPPGWFERWIPLPATQFEEGSGARR